MLYEELNPIRRRRLHQRIGEALEKLYAAPADASGEAAAADQHAQDLAYHFTQAGDLERSLTWSRRAARIAVLVFAHDEALKFLEHARESAEALRRSDDVAAIDEEIGDIHEARGVIPAAVESYERSLAQAATREGRATIKVKVGSAYMPIGDPRGLASLEEALVELDPQTQTNALALATGLVGRYYHYRTEHRKAIEFLERARKLAEPLDDAWTLCNIYSHLAGAHQHLLLYDESDRWARATIALGERKSFGFARAIGNEFLAENAAGRGLWSETLAFAERDRDEGRKIGSLARAAWSGFCHATGLYGKGDLGGAKTAALAALELAEQIGEERLATWIGTNAAAIAADLGDDEAARQHANRTFERAQHLQQLVLSSGALHALGYSSMQRGDLQGALEAYAQYVRLVRDTENGVARNFIMASAADAHLRAGKVDEAESLANKALEVAEFAKAPHYLALARRVLGQIHAARQRYDDAALAFCEAIAGFEKTGSRLELGRALCCRASLRIDRGDAAGARADAARARDLFAETGAARDRERAEGLLR